MDSYLPLKVLSGDTSFFLYYRQHFNDPETADPDRSLFVCRLDKKVKSKEVTGIFGRCGKIESVQTGKFEKSKAAQTASPGTHVFFAVLTFKRKTGLRKALKTEWLQRQLDLFQGEMQVEPQAEDSALTKHIEKMEEGGFQMILPKSNPSIEKTDLFEATINMQETDRISPKKKKNREVFLKDFYNFQVHPDEDSGDPVKKARTQSSSC